MKELDIWASDKWGLTVLPHPLFENQQRSLCTFVCLRNRHFLYIHIKPQRSHYTISTTGSVANVETSSAHTHTDVLCIAEILDQNVHNVQLCTVTIHNDGLLAGGVTAAIWEREWGDACDLPQCAASSKTEELLLTRGYEAHYEKQGSS